MIPTKPDWRAIVLELRRRFGNYTALMLGLAEREEIVSYSTLSNIACGRSTPTWRIGAALLNLHAEGR